MRVELLEIRPDGLLLVRSKQGLEFQCEWLEWPSTSGVQLAPGDSMVASAPVDGGYGIVFGRVGRYTPLRLETKVVIEAAQTLILRCGESAVELRADGKVMVRGEDVLLRAKGTQRIRAGTVSIN